jgi:hypothetical protein
LCGRRRSGTNDDAGDGTTTATILSAALIAEGMKIVAAGANPVKMRPQIVNFRGGTYSGDDCWYPWVYLLVSELQGD